jgi:hypothetical protein
VQNPTFDVGIKGTIWRNTAGKAGKLTLITLSKTIAGIGLDILLEVQPQLDFEVKAKAQASGTFFATASASGMKMIFLYLRDVVNIWFCRRTLGESPTTKRAVSPIFGVTPSHFFVLYFVLVCLCFVFVLCFYVFL